MKPKVVILLSDKRSGSTLFERELCRHSAVRHIRYTPHTYNESHYWVKAACILPTPVEGFSSGVRPHSYGTPAQARKSLVATVQGNVPCFQPPDNDESLVFEGWEALCREFARPVFFEKSPHHPHHWAALELMLAWLQRTEFDVRFIGLVRNPMAVMYSAQELFFTRPEKRQFGWADGNRNIIRFAELLRPKQFKLVRYEDLVADPVEGFAQVCRFIGIDYQPQIGQSVHHGSLFKWRDDPDFDFQLDDTAKALARTLGYRAEDLFNPPKPMSGGMQRLRRNVLFEIKRGQSRLYNRLKRLVD